MTESNTVAQDNRPDRLQAAEADTGYKLNARVKVKGTNHGPLRVVGFARVNVEGIDAPPVRAVVLADPDHLRQQGVQVCILATPDTLLDAVCG